MFRIALASGLFLALALPAAAQERIRLVYPTTQQTTVIERTTVTTVHAGDLAVAPLQAQEIDGMGPPPRHRPLDDPSSMPGDDGVSMEDPANQTGQAVVQDEQGNTVELRSWQAQQNDFGAPPPFEALDRNHDGRISEDEARAYPLLANDFLYAAGKTNGVSRSRYEWWIRQAR